MSRVGPQVGHPRASLRATAGTDLMCYSIMVQDMTVPVFGFSSPGVALIRRLIRARLISGATKTWGTHFRGLAGSTT
jgi:hypothetical protein